MVILATTRPDMRKELEKLEKRVLIQNAMLFHGDKLFKSTPYWEKQTPENVIDFLIETMAVATMKPIKRVEEKERLVA